MPGPKHRQVLDDREPIYGKLQVVCTKKECEKRLNRQRGETHTDAHVAALAERDERKRIRPVIGTGCKEALRAKSVGLLEKYPIPMAELGREQNLAVPRYVFATELEPPDIPPRQQLDR